MPGVCPRCNKNVYFAEEFRCCGKSWHKLCLNCTECSKVVEPGRILEHELKVYCKECHRNLFGTKGYGYGGALVISPKQAVVTPPRESAVVADITEVRQTGGWVSPRLLRSKQKQLQEEVVFEPVTPTLSTVSWGGGFALGKQRSSRKVSPGFGSSVAPGGGSGKPALSKHEESGTRVWKSRDSSRSDEGSNYALSASTYQTKSAPQISLKSTFSTAIKPASDSNKSSNKPVSPSSVTASANLPRSNYKPRLSPCKSFSSKSDEGSSSNYAILASSYQTKPGPQISLKSTFTTALKPTHDRNKSSNKQVSPSSVTASANLPRSGYKPRISPFKSSAPLCSRCSKSVYQAELVRACGGMWHKQCFTCEDCNKLLDSSTLCERGTEIYCRNCYHKNYGPKGVGFGIGANLQAL